MLVIQETAVHKDGLLTNGSACLATGSMHVVLLMVLDSNCSTNVQLMLLITKIFLAEDGNWCVAYKPATHGTHQLISSWELMCTGLMSMTLPLMPRSPLHMMSIASPSSYLQLVMARSGWSQAKTPSLVVSMRMNFDQSLLQARVQLVPQHVGIGVKEFVKTLGFLCLIITPLLALGKFSMEELVLEARMRLRFCPIIMAQMSLSDSNQLITKIFLAEDGN